MQNIDGTIAVQNPNGPVATIGIPDRAIGPAKLGTAGAAPGQALVFDGASAQWQTISGGGGGVASLNSLTGPVTLAAAGGATVSTAGNTITVTAGGGGGSGIQGVENTDNALSITNPGGPTATINVKDLGIGTGKMADGAVTSAKIQDGQVQTGDVADNAVTSAKITDGAVATTDLADASVTATKLNTTSPAATGKVLTATASGMDWQTSSSGVGGTGAPTSLAFWTGPNTLSSDPGLVFTGGKLGIGTANPSELIEVANLIKFGSFSSAFGYQAHGCGVQQGLFGLPGGAGHEPGEGQ